MATSPELKISGINCCLEWNAEMPYEGANRKSPEFRVRGIGCYFVFYKSMNCFCLKLKHCTRDSRNQCDYFDVTIYVEFSAARVSGYRGCFCYGPFSTRFRPKEIAVIFEDCLLESELFSNPLYGPTVRLVFRFSCADRLELPGSEDTTVSDIRPAQPDLEYLSADLGSLLDDQVNPDVRLNCEDGFIRAHRAVLSARSRVFAAMFRANKKRKRPDVVKLDHADLRTTRLFLKFIYSGKIPDLTVQMAPTLYALGEKYDVQALKKTCAAFMAKNVSQDTYTEYLCLAGTHGDETFKGDIIAYIVDNPRLMNIDSWLKFSSEHPNLALEVFQKYIDNLLQSN